MFRIAKKVQMDTLQYSLLLQSIVLFCTLSWPPLGHYKRRRGPPNETKWDVKHFCPIGTCFHYVII